MSTNVAIHRATAVTVSSRDLGGFHVLTLAVTHTHHGAEQVTEIEVFSDKPLVIEGVSFDEFVKCHSLEKNQPKERRIGNHTRTC